MPSIVLVILLFLLCLGLLFASVAASMGKRPDRSRAIPNQTKKEKENADH